VKALNELVSEVQVRILSWLISVVPLRKEYNETLLAVNSFNNTEGFSPSIFFKRKLLFYLEVSKIILIFVTQRQAQSSIGIFVLSFFNNLNFKGNGVHAILGFEA
jgi:hypothetical protein